jgi:acetylcholinesterase
MAPTRGILGSLSLAALTATAQAGKHNTVTLDGYGSFSGTSVNETLSGYALPQTVDAWLGMDYAVQPVGDLRFTPSTWPAPFDGVKDAASYGKACIQELTSALPY